MKNTRRVIFKVLVAVCILVVVVIFIVTYLATHRRDKGDATIELSTSIDKIYLGGSGKIDAVLRYSGDGSIEEGDFKFESDHPDLLYFDQKDGKFPGTYSISDDDKIVRPFDDTVVKITVSSIDDENIEPKDIEITVTDAIPLTIRFYRNREDTNPTQLNIYKGYSIESVNQIQHTSFTIPDYRPSNDFITEWYDIETHNLVEINSNSAYYTSKEIRVYGRYRLSKPLVLSDELTNKDGNGEIQLMPEQYGDIYYGEPISEELLQVLNTSRANDDVWTFEGWYPDINSSELQNGLDINGNFGATTNTLTAKWCTDVNVELLLRLSNGQSQHQSITVVYNGKIEMLPAPDYIAKEDGANFRGWAISFDGGATLETLNTNADGIEQYLINESTVYSYQTKAGLYACVEFELTVDYQNADNKGGGKDRYQVLFNQPISKSIGGVFSTPQKNNWIFNGYFQSPSAKGTQYLDTTVYNIESNTTIYASWRNDLLLKAEINSIEDIELPLVYGEPLDLSNYTYNKQGTWSFRGWYTEPHGLGENLQEISKIALGTTGEQNQREEQYNEILGKSDGGVLYAKWIANEIVLYKNGGEAIGTSDTSLKDIIFGVSLQEQGKKLPVLQREGYTLDKWLAANGEEITDNKKLTILQLPSISAQWEGKQVTVTLTSNGSVNVNIIATMGEDMPKADPPQKPDDRSFNGYYYQDAESSEKKYYYTARMESKRPWDIWSETPVTLEAEWITGLSVEWRFENGTEPLMKIVNKNTLASNCAPKESPEKARDAQYIYEFIGWNTNPQAGVALNLGSFYIQESTTFYAIYSKTLRSYTVHWYNYEGTLLEQDDNVNYGDHPTFNRSNPTRSQDQAYVYTFEGWNTDKEASSMLTLSNYIVTGNVDFYAIYSHVNRKYKITIETDNANVFLNDTPYTNGNTVEVEWGTPVEFCHEDSLNTCDGYSITKQDGTGDVSVSNGYFTMPQCDIKIWAKSHQECIVSGTLITLADGRQVPVEQLKGDEMLLVWNIYTGKFDAAPILFIDSDPMAKYKIINLYFSDGTKVGVIEEHGFWDYNLNEWVFLRNDAEKYIGHWFNKQDIDENGNMISGKVQLVRVVLTEEITIAWSPVTYGHLCYYVNGMLSMPGATEGFINIFDVDSDTLRVDEKQMAMDIAQYGLFTYEDFADYIPEEVYYAFNGQYLKVAMGKGLITWEDIYSLIDRYREFWQ